MTKEDLAEIAARLSKATPGPWVVDGSSVAPLGADGEPSYDPIVDYVYERADAEFIAHARMDMVEMLSYISDLERGATDGETRGDEAPVS